MPDRSRYAWLPRDNVVDPTIFTQLDPKKKLPTPDYGTAPIDAPQQSTLLATTKQNPVEPGGGGGIMPNGGGGGGGITPPPPPPPPPVIGVGQTHTPPLRPPNIRVGPVNRPPTMPTGFIPPTAGSAPTTPTGTGGTGITPPPIPGGTTDETIKYLGIPGEPPIRGGGFGSKIPTTPGARNIQPNQTPLINSTFTPTVGGGGGGTGSGEGEPVSGGDEPILPPPPPPPPPPQPPVPIPPVATQMGSPTVISQLEPYNGDEGEGEGDGEDDKGGGDEDYYSMAKGGIINRPTRVRVGESGPEAVVKVGPQMKYNWRSR